MYSLRQVTYPLIVRTVHADMQDLMLLFTKNELKAFKKPVLNSNDQSRISEEQECDCDNHDDEKDLESLDIVERPIGELKLRWVNFIL